jgi:hypothetical protein
VVPLLRKNRNVAVDIADPLGNVGYLRMNHHRRAAALAASQGERVASNTSMT